MTCSASDAESQYRVLRPVPYLIAVLLCRVPVSMPAETDNVAMMNSSCSHVSTASRKTTIVDGSEDCRENERCLLPCRDVIHIFVRPEHSEYRVAVSCRCVVPRRCVAVSCRSVVSQ